VLEHTHELKRFLKENSRILLSLKEESYKIQTQRSLQHLFCKVFADNHMQKLYMIVLEYAVNCERACPGSGVVLLKKFAEENDGDYKPIKFKKDLVDKLESLNLSQKTHALLIEVLAFCDKQTKIKVKKSSSQKTYIELLNNYFFKTKNLLRSKKSLLEKDAKTLVIDGYIENVSELHHILQHFSVHEPSTPFIIFCRGMSDDVLNTISVNNLRGSLNCFPVKVDFDLEGMNMLVDIAVVCDSDVISCAKGDLISSVQIQDLKTIKEFSLVADGVLIKNDVSSKRVEIHVKNLQKKCEETQADDVNDLLYKRVASLTSSCIEISIPDDINYYSLSKELDEGIRLITAVINGDYNLDKTVDLFHKKLVSHLDETTICNLY